MRRPRLVVLLVGVPLVILAYWIASNTYWEDVKMPMPPKGEAATNPFYVAQRFAEALGARTTRDRVLTVPPADSAIVLSAWHWSMSARRREALERWVEAGGRLVVDSTLIDSDDDFRRWSGLSQELERRSRAQRPDGWRIDDACWAAEEFDRSGAPGSAPVSYQICNFDWLSHIAGDRARAAWMLVDASGIQAMRVRLGKGTVTMINAAPFTHQRLLDGDHGRLFVGATQLRRGDDVHFLSEDDAPWLLALAWQRGAPVIALALALIALALWRGGVRFGPLAAPAVSARRSLAEQIRGTGQFALRHGGGASLHAACLRALDEVVGRRVTGYSALSGGERATALAELTGFNRTALGTALHHRPESRSAAELRRAVALVEAARRRVLLKQLTAWSSATKQV